MKQSVHRQNVTLAMEEKETKMSDKCLLKIFILLHSSNIVCRIFNSRMVKCQVLNNFYLFGFMLVIKHFIKKIVLDLTIFLILIKGRQVATVTSNRNINVLSMVLEKIHEYVWVFWRYNTEWIINFFKPCVKIAVFLPFFKLCGKFYELVVVCDKC